MDDYTDYTELTGEVPALMRGGTLELADLGGLAAERSTGLILTWHDKLVFALDPNAIPLGVRGQQDVRAFVGIGGHLDGDENWSQAVVREALEEANCPVMLGDSAVTYLCREDETPRPLAYRWAEPHRPLLVWVATFLLRRGPERQRIPVTMVNAVFRAAALGRPTPGAEITALLLLDQETLLYAHAAPRPLADLLARGSQIIGQAPTAETLIAPGGSAYFYAQWLAWQNNG
jgi:hypothetical protein